MFFAYPKQMSGEIWIHNIGAAKDAGTMVDGHTGATALGHLAGTVGKAIDSVEVTGIMSMFGEGGMFSLQNCIIGNIPGSIGETSVTSNLNWCSCINCNWYWKLENCGFIPCRWSCDGIFVQPNGTKCLHDN